jgi:hypothetical protein
MHRLVEECAQGKRRLFRWGVLDVLGACDESRVCRSAAKPGQEAQACPLLEECAGRAKERPGNARGVGVGHLSVDDAIAMKARVSRATWESEMLCLRPTRSDAVLPEFDASRHVVASTPWDDSPSGNTENAEETWVAGMDFGFRGLTVVLWGVVREGCLWIVRERAIAGAILQTHVDAIRESRPVPEWVGIDPAGNAINDQTGVSAAAVLRQAGLRVRDRRAPLHAGLESVRARLAPADRGRPRLFIHERCRKLIQSMERYHYPMDTPDSSEPVKDGFDHAVDALRYLVVNLDRSYAAEVQNYLKRKRDRGNGAWERLA